MTVVFDENIPPCIARALKALKQDVETIAGLQMKGKTDTAIIPIIAERPAVLVTKDAAMMRNLAERELVLEHELGVFIMGDGSMKGIDQARLIFRCWPSILNAAEVNRGRGYFAMLHQAGRPIRELVHPPQRRRRTG